MQGRNWWCFGGHGNEVMGGIGANKFQNTKFNPMIA